MKRNKLLFTVFAVFVYMLVGCDLGASSPDSTPLPPTETEVGTVAELNSQSIKVLPTLNSSTPSPNINLSDPTSTALLPNEPVACINLQDPMPIDSEMGLSGILGLIIASNNVLPDDPFDYASSQSILLGGQPLQERVLFPSREGIREIGFSSNGEWFAYQTNPGNLQGEPPSLFIHLIGVKGKTLTTPLPLQEDGISGYWFSQWINNELMLLIYDLTPRMGGESRHTLSVFNPFTGERHDDLLSELPYWNQETTIYFSPDMTRAVYAGRDSESSVLVLWDVEQHRVLWQKIPFISDVRFDEVGIGSRIGFGNLAIWSPDSSGFVFSAVERMGENDVQYFSYLIDREGEQEQILISTTDQRNNPIIYGGTWSADQRYLVYLGAESMMLYDFAFNEVIELCPGLPPYISEVLWSPDSRYLAFMSPIDEQQHLLVLNIYTGEVFTIREIRNFFPAGWFVNEDWLTAAETDE